MASPPKITASQVNARVDTIQRNLEAKISTAQVTADNATKEIIVTRADVDKIEAKVDSQAKRLVSI